MPARLDREVLIIDDDVDITRLVSHMLRSVVERIRVENSGKRGLAAMRERRPDLILCDVKMPDLDGFALRREISANPLLSSIPFLFLSAQHTVEEQLAGLRAGADGFIVKPFSSEALIAAVVHHLETSRAIPHDAGGLLTGRLDAIELTDLLQLLESSRATGVLDIHGSAISGELVLREGRLITARVNNRTGEDAALRLIWMSNGSFQFDKRPVDDMPVSPGHKEWVIGRLLIDAAWLQDELKRLGSQAPGVDDGFEIRDREAAAELFPELPAWQEIVGHWNADLSIGQLADQLEISSYRLRAILGGAAEKGVVRIIAAPPAATV